MKLVLISGKLINGYRTQIEQHVKTSEDKVQEVSSAKEQISVLFTESSNFRDNLLELERILEEATIKASIASISQSASKAAYLEAFSI